MSTTTTVINGIDTQALMQFAGAVQQDPAQGLVSYKVASRWKGGTRMEAQVDGFTLGGTAYPNPFSIGVDEPAQLLGTNTAPSPSELIMSGLNACMMVGYVANAALKGITLEKLEIETTGSLDLRGFLGLDASVKPGFDEIQYTVRIKGDGTPEQIEEIHQTVIALSPNRWTIANAVRLVPTLVVE
jgi:uncharacterized OsmC-like protein